MVEVEKKVADLEMLVRQAREMLIWCSGSPSFQVEGEARVGWVNGVMPLLARMEEMLRPTQEAWSALPSGGPQPNVMDTAILLAREHMDDDRRTVAVYWAPHPHEVRLIDVTRDTVNSGEVFPFRFKADPPEVPYPVVQMVVHPDEWAAIEAGTLTLPDGYPSPCDLVALARRSVTSTAR